MDLNAMITDLKAHFESGANDARKFAEEYLPGLADLAEVSPLEIILSGGVALLDDLRRLKRMNAPTVVGVIVGRALSEKSFTLADAQAVFAD